ncbi:hypothetical protein LV716_11765 [Flagellimonas sp. HMM57]|uniref:hypothetical protein n=1 Tax=unclassified Flagellimonas TaxID=2644544 RepID=UPI0013D5533F|nr:MULTISPECIES: hypothetical protein [unclassified Flagellimonas]UII74933.1 hypothetical protein LV716_11765 [Flagellimonas sp. HMM57]
MKTYNNKIAILGLALATLFACDDDEKVVDQILAQVGTGAVIRTIDETNDLVYNFDTNLFESGSSYTIDLEEQDEEGGDLLESVEVYVNFDDNSDNGDDMSTTEVLLQTLAASDFTDGERGLPVATISYTSDELITATSIDESMIVGKDRFEFRLVLSLTNGETYTNADVGGPVSGGAYFSAPFEYFPVIACSITDDLSGTHSYVTTILTSAPGQLPPGEDVPVACTAGTVVAGDVTWEQVAGGDGSPISGEYTSSDMSFGQFESCYPGRGPATGEDVTIIWDCISLNPDGEVYLKNSVVVPNDDDEDTDFTYGYTITSVAGAEMTISFSNSLGDTGTVVLTREGGEDWPAIFLGNNPE